MNALLVGNGFTSQIIKDYSNRRMMRCLKEKLPKILLSVNSAFNAFRISSEPLEFAQVAAGYAGSLVAGGFSLDYPITKITYDKNIKNQIVKKLEEKGFENSEGLYTDYFENYGLIYETQHDSITNIESALKVVHLFMRLNLFSQQDYDSIIKIANQIYYNNGKCTIRDVTNIDIKKAKEFFSSFDVIFTTNYDLVIDTLLDFHEVLHLHGGYNYKSQYEKVKYLLRPESSCLIWGFNSETKEQLINKGLTYSTFTYSNFTWGPSLLWNYMKNLKSENIKKLSIFGYSGENDNHINNSIKENINIEKITYYTGPHKIHDNKEIFKKKTLFCNKNVSLELRSWKDVWDNILTNLAPE